MKNAVFQFDFGDLNLTASQIESIMGYSDGEAERHFHELIAETLDLASKICTIRAEYRIFSDVKFDDKAKSIEVGDESFDIGKIIFGQIKKSTSVALFLCTAGEEISQLSKKAMTGKDMLGGYIYDIVGSEIAEAAADLMQNALEKAIAPEGLKMTNRFSPGYCGWNVAEQHKLFMLIPGTWCGIRLNQSALMNPEKSVSGIIGIGADVKHLPYTCSLCDMKDCIYRRKKV
jgi:hypothetical protein